MPVFYQRLSNSVDRIGRSFVGLWIVIVVGSIVTTFFLSRGYAGYHELRTAHEQQHVALVQQHTELMQCKEKLDDLAKRPLPIDPVPKLNERISQLEETLATRNKEWLSKLEICRRPEKFGPTIK
jgi:cell division protein FtsB